MFSQMKEFFPLSKQLENIMLKAKWGDTEVTDMSKITQEKSSI